MYKTLKEMQEAIPYEELYRYTKESLDKSPAEIKELLKSHGIEVSDSVAVECFEYMKDTKTISDNELENVTGGTCNYSLESYSTLGIECSLEYGQKPDYFPFITQNKPCKISNGKACKECKWAHFVRGYPHYCKARSDGHDPCRD